MRALSPAEARDRFLAVFGGLFPRGEWPPESLGEALALLSHRFLGAGETLIREGQGCGAVPFVLEGAIRVFKRAESGREITLYRIEAGQSCILSSGCVAAAATGGAHAASGGLEGLAAFPASAVAEGETSAAFLPVPAFRALLAEGPSFRGFVLDQYSRRMAEVIELVEEVAFRHLDERLRQWLADRVAGKADRRVVVTHQEIADQLGSSREVVSRILKDWEQRGALRLSRGEIEVLSGFEKLPL
jgi:CRP/FNR family transcriptional regulator, anaerobic regulatory protein